MTLCLLQKLLYSLRYYFLVGLRRVWSVRPQARFRLCNPAVHVWSALNLPGWMPGAPPSAQESRSERETATPFDVTRLLPDGDIMTNNLSHLGAVHFLIRPRSLQLEDLLRHTGREQGWKTNNRNYLASSQVCVLHQTRETLTRVSKALGLPVFPSATCE